MRGSSVHPTNNLGAFRYGFHGSKWGVTLKGTTTGIFGATHFERTEARWIFMNRMMANRNYVRRHNWKIEDAHHTLDKHTYSKRHQKFPIKDREVQRYEYFVDGWAFPIKPDPWNDATLSNTFWLHWRRDATVRNGPPKNYLKMLCSEHFNEEELTEYLNVLYKFGSETRPNIMHLELEKVDEQTFNRREMLSPMKTTDRSIKDYWDGGQKNTKKNKARKAIGFSDVHLLIRIT